MAYAPKNSNVYEAAFAGAFGGMLAGTSPGDTTQADYNAMSAAASAYAQEFDTLWNSAIANNFQVQAIQLASKAIWESRTGNLATQTPASYAGVCNSIIAAVNGAPNNAIGGAYAPQGVGGNISAAIFGDGSDGTVVFDGSTSVAGCSGPVGSVYTMTRDCFYQNATVNAGVTVITAGSRLFVAGTLDIKSTASINATGNSGSGSGAGSATSSNTLANGNAGGAGGINGVGTVGGAATHGAFGSNSAGNGAAGGANPGGNGGAVTALNTSPRELWSALSAEAQSIPAAFSGGAGGGGGGASAVGTSGGGGGGGGGVLMIAANTYIYNDNTSSGYPNVRGGNGGNASGGANGGGGGGGSGGLLIVISRNSINAATGLPPAMNMVGGGGGGTGVGTGSAGSNGGNGISVFLSA